VVEGLKPERARERVPDPQDGRGVMVRPTPATGYEAGRRRIAGLEDAWAERVGPRRFVNLPIRPQATRRWANEIGGGAGRA
jgi:hypothetical protein